MKHKLKRFDNLFSDEAKAYGPGAFAWRSDEWGGHIHFRFPSSIGKAWDNASIAVTTQRDNDDDGDYPDYAWDGDVENPNIPGPIAFYTSSYETYVWKGRFRDGYLETIRPTIEEWRRD